MSKGWSERLVKMKMENGIPMNVFIENEFQRVLKDDINLCSHPDADLSFYLGYFQCAKELEIISEERFEEIAEMLKDVFTCIYGICYYR